MSRFLHFRYSWLLLIFCGLWLPESNSPKASALISSESLTLWPWKPRIWARAMLTQIPFSTAWAPQDLSVSQTTSSYLPFFLPQSEYWILTKSQRYMAQWSSSLGRRWQNCFKKIRRLFNGYVTTYGKTKKGHVCLYAHFSLFGLETHFITKFPYLLAFFGLLKLIWGGYSCFRNV